MTRPWTIAFSRMISSRRARAVSTSVVTAFTPPMMPCPRDGGAAYLSGGSGDAGGAGGGIAGRRGAGRRSPCTARPAPRRPTAPDVVEAVPDEPGRVEPEEVGARRADARPLLELGARETRAQRGRGDPRAGELGRQALGEDGDPRLGRGVGAGGHPPGHRRDVDHRPAPTGDHGPGGRVREHEDGPW